MTAREIAARLRAASAAVGAELLAAEQTNLLDVLATAERFSSGTATPQTLRLADHPYAVRHGTPFLDPGIVNIGKTRVFVASWRGRGPKLESGFVRSSTFNIDPKAPYLEQKQGAPKSTMFRRPVDQRIAQDAAPRVRERRILALRRALTGGKQ